MATEVIKTIGPGKDYASVLAFLQGENRNLVSVDEIAVGEVHPFTDTTAVNLVGGAWTTDATRRIVLRTHPTARHSNAFDANLFVLSGGGHLFEMDNADVTIEGMQLLLDLTVGEPIGFLFDTSTTGSIKFRSNIIKGSGVRAGSGLVAGVLNQPGGSVSGVSHYSNNIIYGIRNADDNALAAAGMMFGSPGSSDYIYHNLTHNCTVGLRNRPAFSPTMIAKNHISQNCVDGYAGTFDGASTNNVSDIASDAPGSNPITGNVVFVNEGSDDFHVDSSDTVALNAGADLRSDANLPVTLDGENQIRDASPDAGPDEFIVPSPRTIGNITTLRLYGTFGPIQTFSAKVEAVAVKWTRQISVSTVWSQEINATDTWTKEIKAD